MLELVFSSHPIKQLPQRAKLRGRETKYVKKVFSLEIIYFRKMIFPQFCSQICKNYRKIKTEKVKTETQLKEKRNFLKKTCAYQILR